jgi:tetratricopeptide (TPR) repeat protein
LLVHIAAHSGRLDTLLAELKKQGGTNVQTEPLIGAAMHLKQEGQTAAADKLLEFAYISQLSQPYVPSSAYFGLAELRLSQQRNDEAFALLRDVTLSVGAPFENLAQAGRMLEKAGLKNEAREYYEQWHKALPWDASASIAAARLSGSTTDLDKMRQMAAVEYGTRVEAAGAMRGLHSAVAGKTELDLLTQEQVSAAQAAIPYAALARLRAAESTTDPATKVKLLSEAIAIRPELMDPRQDLARAALAAKEDRLAVTAYESQPGTGMPMYGRRAGNLDSQRISLPEASRNLKEGIAQAYRRLGQFAEARAVYSGLLAMDLPDAQKKRMQQAVNGIDGSVRLEAANRRRAPTVTALIEQSVPVRARLKAPPPLDPDDDQAAAAQNQEAPEQ